MREALKFPGLLKPIHFRKQVEKVPVREFAFAPEIVKDDVLGLGEGVLGELASVVSGGLPRQVKPNPGKLKELDSFYEGSLYWE